VNDRTGEGRFPPDFVWGTAASAYQVEGATAAAGRGESIWDRFCATPGKVRAGEDGRTACDFYHRYAADIALMQELGVDAFRFSVAWPRIVPEGRGAVNSAGLDFYDRLVDQLLAAGVEPVVTLYHWDLPQTLEDEGGWTSRETIAAFVTYAGHVVERLGDRVSRWITHNEPWVAAWLGYGWGVHAPGRTTEREALAAAHHLLVSHGLAVDAVRSACPSASVGISLNLFPIDSASDEDADRDAARYVDGFNNRWFLEPLYSGAYPEDMVEAFKDSMPRIEAGDMAAIAARTDFLGVNYYTRHVVEATEARPLLVPVPGADQTDMGWEVYPEGLRRLLGRLDRDYAPPELLITENGAAFADVQQHDGRICDVERVAYLQGHIDAIEGSLADGVPVKGYFAWSLLDNFEWAFGYSKRFGLVYVDYPTLERIPKSSFYWYRDRIAATRARPEGEIAGAES
jgi:beta-glucosidase